MDTVLLFKKDLDHYSTASLETLQRYFDLPATKRADLLWLLAIYQAQNNRQGTMRRAASSQVGDTCANLILGATSEHDIESINDYAQRKGIPLIKNNTPAEIRKTCDPLLRDIVSVIDPDTNTDRMSTQNLARWYQKISEEKAAAEEAAAEEAFEAFEPEEISIDEMKQLVQSTKMRNRMNEKNQLRVQYARGVICKQDSVINERNIPYVSSSELKGRRCIIPRQMWNRIFTEEDLQMQVFLEMTVYHVYLQKTYVLITGFHDDDDRTIQVSQLVSLEFGNPPRKVASIRDCIVNTIQSIEMKLLRDPGLEPQVDDAIIKELLADQLAQLGVPMVGDILNVKANSYEFSYQITQITDTEGSSVLTAAIPPVETDVDLVFTVQTKQDLLMELSLDIPDITNPKYDSLI